MITYRKKCKRVVLENGTEKSEVVSFALYGF